MVEDFLLKWNDHHSVFFNSVEQLCRGEILTDVTLSCGGVDFNAHKLVLSVCSGYFAGLFSRNARKYKNDHVVIYLKDVDPRHLELILSYMYRGEISVEESELVGLVSTAKGLQVKGLSDEHGCSSVAQLKGEKPKERQKPLFGKRKNSSESNDPSKHIKEENSSILNSSEEGDDSGGGGHGGGGHGVYPPSDDIFPVPEGGGPYINEQPLGHIGGQQGFPGSGPATASTSGQKSGSGGAAGSSGTVAGATNPADQYFCRHCDKGFTHKWMLDRHLVTHTGVQNFACGICWRRFSLHASCVRHLKNVHRETCGGQENLGRLVIKYPAQQPPPTPNPPPHHLPPQQQPQPHQHHFHPQANGGQ